MAKQSAGVLLYRRSGGVLELFLAHPGGPFWASKDAGAWSIPKGEIEAGENAELAAKREFLEETGLSLVGDLTPLGSFRQPSGKVVHAFALEGDADPAQAKSNVCQIEWPPKTGRILEIPEIDRAGWFEATVAMEKIVKGQRPIIEALLQKLGGGVA